MPFEEISYWARVSNVHFMKTHNFDFNDLFYNAIGFVPLNKIEETRERIKQKNEPFKIDKWFDPKLPDCILYCNSKFTEIKEWLKTDSEETRIDLMLTPFKHFNSL